MTKWDGRGPRPRKHRQAETLQSTRDDQEAWCVALPQELGDAVDAMVARFLGTFSDPLHHLPWDEGEYVWIVDQWTTEEAMEDVFGPLEATVASRIADYLNDMCPYWVREADMDRLAEQRRFGNVMAIRCVSHARARSAPW